MDEFNVSAGGITNIKNKMGQNPVLAMPGKSQQRLITEEPYFANSAQSFHRSQDVDIEQLS